MAASKLDSPPKSALVSEESLEHISRLLNKLSKKPIFNEQESKVFAKILSQAANISTSLGAEPAALAHYLSARAAFRSDSELADELGVNRSSVTRWKQGHAPEAKNKRTLINLDVVVSLLTGYLDRSVIPDWLSGINPMLGNRRPIDVLRSGRVSEVIAAIEAEQSGAFA